MGHAYEKKKEKPHMVTKWELENIGCDEAANERVEEIIAPHSFSPLRGYQAMLTLGDN